MADTIHTIDRKVEKGMKVARKYAKDNPVLMAFLDALEFSYQSRKNDMISLASHIYAFTTRDKQVALDWMEKTRRNIEETKLTNTKARSELDN